MNIDWTFRPRLADTLKNYSRQDLIADLIAGLTVGIVALPLAMGFGIASGVTPQAGIFTAVVAGFIISALGGSRVQIGGPTGAFVSIVFSTIAVYGLENLYICTLMAGLMLLVMGFARLGGLIKYIPYPVTMGFTCGIAVLIFSTQIKDFLGLQVEKVPPDFVDKLKMLFQNLRNIDVPTVALGVLSILIIKTWPAKWGRRIPGSIVALILGTLGNTGLCIFQYPCGNNWQPLRWHPAWFPEVSRAEPAVQRPLPNVAPASAFVHASADHRAAGGH